VVIDGVFDATPTGGVLVHATAGPDANSFADVQACVRLRQLRYCARPHFVLDRLRELPPERSLRPRL
jgi:hypothetical protein